MINFSTPSEQIMAELFEEEAKAIYWLKKHYHGERGYEKMRDELLVKCQQTRQTQISEVVEFISSKGNRWMAFECCQYYRQAKMSNTIPMAFCYYETYGSVGAYLVGRFSYDKDGKNKVVLHFTNHFFLRFCQRLGVDMRSRWMVQRFVEVIPGFLIGYNGKDDKGRDKYDVRLPASIGRGIMYDDAPIIEIRTYLTDRELNKKQLRETENLRAVYERQTFEPLDVRYGRLVRSEDFAGAMTKEIENVSDMTGISRDSLVFATNIRIFIATAVADLGYIRNDDMKGWQRFGELTAKVDLLNFVTDYPMNGGGREKAKQLYDAICEIGKRCGIKGFDSKAVMDKTLEKWKEAVNERV